MAITAWSHDTPFEPGTIIRAGAMNTKLDGIATTLGELANLSNSFNVQLPGNFTGNPVIPNTASYTNSLLYINSSGNMALYSKDDFDQSVQDAANSAAASLQSANDSEDSADASEASQLLSAKYANEAYNVEVEAGKYSSYHWSERSRLWANEAVDTAVANGEYSAYHWSRKAYAWSETPQGTEVEPGRFSAKHWALTAEQYAQTTAGSIIFSGYFDASLGTYPVTDENNRMWKITVAGTLGGVDYEVGDSIVYYFADDSFFKIDSTDKVMSVNGKQGAVSLDADDVGAVASASVTSYSLSLFGNADATAWRTDLGLGAAATRGVGTSTGQLVPYESFATGAFTTVGTAATRDVGIADGNVIEVGSHGLVRTVYESGVDVNVPIYTSGFGIRFVISPVNGPYSTDAINLIEFGNTGTGTTSQFAIRRSDGSQDVAFRQGSTDNWVDFWTKGNLPDFRDTGLGATLNEKVVVSELNTLSKTQFFSSTGTTTGAPPSGGSYFNGLHLDRSNFSGLEDINSQIAIGASNTFWFRHNTTSSANWRQVAITNAGHNVIFGNVTAANYYPTSSDQRLKTKLRPVVINYRQAAVLQSWVFQWKDDEAVPESQRGKTEIGLMAQEIMEVFPPSEYPSLVIKKDNGYYTIDPDKILMMRVFAKVEPRLVTWYKDLKCWLKGGE